MRAAKRGVAGKGHFEGRRENTHACAGAVCRQNESGFGQIELQRKRLHLGVTDTDARFEYTKWITAKSGFGEDVDEAVGEGAHERLE